MDTKRRIQRNKVTIAERRGRRGKRHVEEKQKKKVKGGKGGGGGGGEVRELAVRLGSVRFFLRRNRETKDLPTGEGEGE